MDNIGIFCSSRGVAIPLYRGIIIPLLAMLYDMGTRHVLYGGGDNGLMGLIYHEGTELGMTVTGHNLERWSNPNQYRNEIVYTTLLDRQNGLIQASQMYIVLPGGIGTIYELTQVLCNNDVDKVSKKVILYNYDHYYDGFIMMIEHSVSIGLTDYDRLHFHIVTNPEELKQVLLQNIQNY